MRATPIRPTPALVRRWPTGTAPVAPARIVLAASASDPSSASACAGGAAGRRPRAAGVAAPRPRRLRALPAARAIFGRRPMRARRRCCGNERAVQPAGPGRQPTAGVWRRCGRAVDAALIRPRAVAPVGPRPAWTRRRWRASGAFAQQGAGLTCARGLRHRARGADAAAGALRALAPSWLLGARRGAAVVEPARPRTTGWPTAAPRCGAGKRARSTRWPAWAGGSSPAMLTFCSCLR